MVVMLKILFVVTAFNHFTKLPIPIVYSPLNNDKERALKLSEKYQFSCIDEETFNQQHNGFSNVFLKYLDSCLTLFAGNINDKIPNNIEKNWHITEIRTKKQKKLTSFTIKFEDILKKRGKQISNELLIRACFGNKETITQEIWDMTAGVGRDSFLLAAASAGRSRITTKDSCNVIMFERNAVLGSLLEDALERIQDGAKGDPILQDIGSRMRLERHDSLKVLTNIVNLRDASSTTTTSSPSPSSPSFCQLRPDVIYLDPMFPKTGKTALVKKDMQMIHRLLHFDSNDEIDTCETSAEIEKNNIKINQNPDIKNSIQYLIENEEEGRKGVSKSINDEELQLLELSCKCAKKRTVVKRPINAQPIGNYEPSFRLLGSKCRFDIYLPGHPLTVGLLPRS